MRGHIHKRQRKGKNGKTRTLWYAVIDVGQGEGGRRRQKWLGGFETRREAEQALADLAQSLDKNTYIAPQRVTLGEFVRDDWLPTMRTQVKLSTWDSYRRNLENHVLPALGGLPIQQITPGHLNSLYRGLLAGGNARTCGELSAKTVRNIHGTISKVMADAVDYGLLGRNVAFNARPPKPRTSGPKEIRFWTPDELSEFLASVRDDRLHALWHLAAMTGLRRGELLGLRWEDLDFQRSRVAVRQTLISVAYELEISTPKSHSARVIDIDPGTVAVLGEHREGQEHERAEHGDGYQDVELVFRKADGSVIHPDVIRQMFDKRVKRAGVKRIRFHDLRHTHATIGLRAGVPVKVMSERLGHSTPAFTLQQYAHVIPGMQAEAAQAIAGLVFGSTDQEAENDAEDQTPVDEDDDES